MGCNVYMFSIQLSCSTIVVLHKSFHSPPTLFSGCRTCFRLLQFIACIVFVVMDSESVVVKKKKGAGKAKKPRTEFEAMTPMTADEDRKRIQNMAISVSTRLL